MKSCALLASAALAAGVLGWIDRAHATLIVVPNFSFESPDVPDNTFSDTDIDGDIPNWTFTKSENGTNYAGVWDPVAGDYPGTTGNGAIPGSGQGTQVGFIYLDQADNPVPQPLNGVIVTSTELATIQSNTTYTLTVALGNSLLLTPGEVDIRLLANGQEASSTTVIGDAIPNGTFTDFTTSFTTGAASGFVGQQLSIRIAHIFNAEGVAEVDFDNIRLNSTPFIPEPASAALSSLVACAALARRRRDSFTA
jgi:hypothetical protein